MLSDRFSAAVELEPCFTAHKRERNQDDLDRCGLSHNKLYTAFIRTFASKLLKNYKLQRSDDKGEPEPWEGDVNAGAKRKQMAETDPGVSL